MYDLYTYMDPLGTGAAARSRHQARMDLKEHDIGDTFILTALG